MGTSSPMPNSMGPALKCAHSVGGNQLFTWEVLLAKNLMNFQAMLNMVWQPELFKRKERAPPLLCAQALPRTCHSFWEIKKRLNPAELAGGADECLEGIRVNPFLLLI